MTITGTVANAAENGMLPLIPMKSSTTLPMKLELLPPTSSGVMQSPSVSENVKMAPDTPPGESRHEVREREGKHRVGDRHGGGDADCPACDAQVRAVRVEKVVEVLERPLMNELAGERVHAPEGRHEERDECREVDEDE